MSNEPSDFLKQVSFTLDLAFKIKTKMLEKNLRAARVRCEKCKPERQYITARLVGRKNHIHMACSGSCGTMLME